MVFGFIKYMLSTQTIELLFLLVMMMVLRLVVIMVSNASENITELIKQFVKSEIINICLVFACVILDRTIVLSSIKISWSIAALLTLLIIFDEITSIANKAGQTLSSQFIISTVAKIRETLKK